MCHVSRGDDGESGGAVERVGRAEHGVVVVPAGIGAVLALLAGLSSPDVRVDNLRVSYLRQLPAFCQIKLAKMIIDHFTQYISFQQSTVKYAVSQFIKLNSKYET